MAHEGHARPASARRPPVTVHVAGILIGCGDGYLLPIESGLSEDGHIASRRQIVCQVQGCTCAGDKANQVQFLRHLQAVDVRRPHDDCDGQTCTARILGNAQSGPFRHVPAGRRVGEKESQALDRALCQLPTDPIGKRSRDCLRCWAKKLQCLRKLKARQYLLLQHLQRASSIHHRAELQIASQHAFRASCGAICRTAKARRGLAQKAWQVTIRSGGKPRSPEALS